MAETILVHGYATGIEVPPFYKPANTKNYEFRAFDNHLSEGKATIFEWGTALKLALHQAVVPKKYSDHYWLEKQNAESEKVLADLEKVLEEQQPKDIIAHSMGGHLMMNYLATKKLPDSVEHLVFLQADTRRPDELPEELLSRITQGKLQWTNFYCPWDITLMLSVLLNKKMPIGLIGMNNPYVKDHHFPLNPKTRQNLHLSSMSDPKLLKLLNKA